MAKLSGDKILRQRVDQALKEGAPGFVAAVEKAKAEHADYVILPFRAFRTEPDLFFQAVQYASMEGVPLLIVPEDYQ
jgi:hypothetical protein